MSTFQPGDDYSDFTPDQLRQAAQRVSTDLATDATIGELRPEYVESQQDLKTYLVNEAARRQQGN